MNKLILGPIIGGLTSSGANLWGRSTSRGVLHAWLGRQPDLSDGTLAAVSLELRPEDGFCGVAPIRNLAPNTRYYYALTLSDVPPDPADSPYPALTTCPPKGEPVSFNFAFGSCFLPDDPHSGSIFESLDERRKQDALRFWLLIGDQIYSDDEKHNGLGKIAVTLDEYRQCYRYAWGRSALRRLFANLPAFMTLDDHEVEDDWRWMDTQRLHAVIPWWNRVIRWLQRKPLEERTIPRKRVLDALQAYWEHQAMHGPPLVDEPQVAAIGQYNLDEPRPGSLAYTFEYGATAFFVLDTRSQRVRGGNTRQILDEAQWEALEAWLLRVKDTNPVKFIISSGAILYRMFLDIPADRWSGFPRERDRLLNFLQANAIEGLYILTGDLHTAHAIRAVYSSAMGERIPIWEFCSTPFRQKPKLTTRLLYNPFPFKPLSAVGRLFAVPQNNFGVIRVEFLGGGKPEVSFEIYGEDNGLLARART